MYFRYQSYSDLCRLAHAPLQHAGEEDAVGDGEPHVTAQDVAPQHQEAARQSQVSIVWP